MIRPVTRRGAGGSVSAEKKISPPWKNVLDIVKNIWAPLSKLFASPGFSNWLGPGNYAQGRNDGGARWAQFPGHRITAGVAKCLLGCRKVPTISQVLSSMQQIFFRKTSGSNMGAPDLLLAAGAV